MTRFIVSAVSVALLFCSCEISRAASVSLQEGVDGYAHQDVHLRSDEATFPNGASTTFLIGTTDSGVELRSLIDFDLTSVAGTLAGATITDVSLVLYSTDVDADDVGFEGMTVNLSTYGFAFDEDLTSWSDPDGDGAAGTGDTTAGGTIGTFLTSSGPLADSGSVDAYHTYVSTPAFISAVESALSGDNVLRMIMNEDSPTFSSRDIAFYGSSDNTDLARRPELIITFDPVPEPASALLVLCACLLGLVGVRRR